MGRRNTTGDCPMEPKGFDEKFSSGASIDTGVSGRARFDAAGDNDRWRRRKSPETSPYDISEIDEK